MNSILKLAFLLLYCRKVFDRVKVSEGGKLAGWGLHERDVLRIRLMQPIQKGSRNLANLQGHPNIPVADNPLAYIAWNYCRPGSIFWCIRCLRMWCSLEYNAEYIDYMRSKWTWVSIHWWCQRGRTNCLSKEPQTLKRINFHSGWQ